MAALHAAERRRRTATEAAGEAVRQALEDAVEELRGKERLREDWRRREHWVAQQALEKRGPKNGKNRAALRLQHAAEAPPPRDREELRRSIRRAAEDLQSRSQRYEHTAAAVVVREELGFPRLEDLAKDLEVRRLRVLDEGAEAVFESEEVELLEPKKAPAGQAAAKERRAGEGVDSAGARAAAATVKKRCSRDHPKRADWATALTTVDLHDREFALAHENETRLKLGVEMSLAEAEIGSGEHCGPALGPTLEPDEPVEAFLQPDAQILPLGRARGGEPEEAMERRSHGGDGRA